MWRFVMAVKANLKIILKADDTVVAESDDATLWQKVLVAIDTGTPSTAATNSNGGKIDNFNDLSELSKNGSSGGSKIASFAKEIGVSVEILQGACSPSTEAPYIHLDKHHWEALKKLLPQRGAKAIADVVVAATLLVLWKDKADLGATIFNEASAVLGTLELKAKNPTRSIRNCEWLQIRGKNIVLNPAQTSQAITVAKAYCLKKDPHSME